MIPVPPACCLPSTGHAFPSGSAHTWKDQGAANGSANRITINFHVKFSKSLYALPGGAKQAPFSHFFHILPDPVS